MTEPRLPVVAVLCADSGERPPRLDVLASRAEFVFTDATGLADAIAGADALVLWDFFSRAVAHAWPRADRLRWIHVCAAGVDKLLFDELRASAVVVTNARGIFDRPIAEFVLASVLAHAKLLHESMRLQQAHDWRHREPRLLAGQRALVVGTGAIGREIGRLLAAVGVRVDGAARAAREGDPDFATVIASSDLAARAGDYDVIVNAAPLTDATRGLFDAAVFAAVRPGVHLVNIGRGETVDEEALLAALRSGRVGAASLDVFATEPLPPDHPLWDEERVAISAHMSGDVVGWVDALERQLVDNLERWLDGRPLLNVVDKRLGFVPPPGPPEPPEGTRDE